MLVWRSFSSTALEVDHYNSDINQQNIDIGSVI